MLLEASKPYSVSHREPYNVSCVVGSIKGHIHPPRGRGPKQTLTLTQAFSTFVTLSLPRAIQEKLAYGLTPRWPESL
jgi:hypothetical protein